MVYTRIDIIINLATTTGFDEQYDHGPLNPSNNITNNMKELGLER